ncbi:MULE transposase domain-containing protein [Plasmodiophora brassicae]
MQPHNVLIVNTNRHIFAMCAELVDPSSPLFSGVRSIHLKYPEVGHTFLICDRIFSTIERKAKQIRIYDPKDWVTAITQFYKDRPNPHRAKWMDRLDFLNYAEHLEPRYKFVGCTVLGGRASDPAESLSISPLRWIHFGQIVNISHPGEMWAKTSLKVEDAWTKICFTKPAPNEVVVLEACYPVELPIDAIKMDALHGYTPNMPVQYRHLWPAPDQEKLKAAKRAQAAKRQARRATPMNELRLLWRWNLQQLTVSVHSSASHGAPAAWRPVLSWQPSASPDRVQATDADTVPACSACNASIFIASIGSSTG